MSNSDNSFSSKSQSKSQSKSHLKKNNKSYGRGKHPNSLANLKQGKKTIKRSDNDRFDSKLHVQKQIESIVNKSVGYEKRSHNKKIKELQSQINNLESEIKILNSKIVDLQLENTLLKCEKKASNVFTVLVDKCYEGVNELIKTCTMRMKAKPRYLDVNIHYKLIYLNFCLCYIQFGL